MTKEESGLGRESLKRLSVSQLRRPCMPELFSRGLSEWEKKTIVYIVDL